MQEGTPVEETLAKRLGLTVEQLRGRLGYGWTQAHIDPDRELEDWLVAGDPPQLLLGFPDGIPHLALPAGTWTGVAKLTYHPDRLTMVDPLDTQGMAQVRAELLHRRRSAFRYCAYCMRQAAPENRVDDICMPCATAVDGVVF